MQIMIDIPEEMYKEYMFVNLGRGNGKSIVYNLLKAIKNGRPLPEHHGRLIDADELKSMSYEVLVDTDNPNRSDGLSACNGLVEDDIDLAPTIIEANEEE